MKIWFSILIALGISSLPSYGSTQYATPSVAGVTWITYDNRDDFVKAPKLCEDLVSGQLGAKEDAYFSLGRNSSLDEFQAKITQAVATLKNKPLPYLIISMNGHGSSTAPGSITRQLCDEGDTAELYSPQKVVSAIYDGIEDAHGPPQLNVIVIYQACYSGGIIGDFKNAHFKERRDFNVQLYTSSETEESSFDNNLFDAISQSDPVQMLTEDGCVDPSFALNASSKDGPSTIRIWSSKGPVFDYLELQKTANAEESAVLNSDPIISRLFAIRELVDFGRSSEIDRNFVAELIESGEEQYLDSAIETYVAINRKSNQIDQETFLTAVRRSPKSVVYHRIASLLNPSVDQVSQYLIDPTLSVKVIEAIGFELRAERIASFNQALRRTIKNLPYEQLLSGKPLPFDYKFFKNNLEPDNRKLFTMLLSNHSFDKLHDGTFDRYNLQQYEFARTVQIQAQRDSDDLTSDIIETVQEDVFQQAANFLRWSKRHDKLEQIDEMRISVERPPHEVAMRALEDPETPEYEFAVALLFTIYESHKTTFPVKSIVRALTHPSPLLRRVGVRVTEYNRTMNPDRWKELQKFTFPLINDPETDIAVAASFQYLSTEKEFDYHAFYKLLEYVLRKDIETLGHVFIEPHPRDAQLLLELRAHKYPSKSAPIIAGFLALNTHNNRLAKEILQNLLRKHPNTRRQLKRYMEASAPTQIQTKEAIRSFLEEESR